MPFYRTVITYEILTDVPYFFEDLGQVHYDVIEGEASGKLLSEVSEEVTRQEMGHLLIAQGSDPSFLLGEEYENDILCEQCGNPMVINEDGTTNHVSDGFEIDHDADGDHVAIAPQEEEDE